MSKERDFGQVVNKKKWRKATIAMFEHLPVMGYFDLHCVLVKRGKKVSGILVYASAPREELKRRLETHENVKEYAIVELGQMLRFAEYLTDAP